MRNAEFNDPRLVQVYDADFGWGRGDDFFLSVVNEKPCSRVLDLGCGTGRLALAMAAGGHAVTGVDPAHASLEAARAKPGADRVAWIEGTSAILPAASFDIAVMTGHVAQFFVAEGEWAAVLSDLRRALVPGGRLVFDSRDPLARAWQEWNPGDSRHAVTLPDGRAVTVWTEVTEVAGHVVTAALHHRCPREEELLSTVVLRFRGEDELRSSLSGAGFGVERIYGGWDRGPVGSTDGELLVISRSLPG